MRLKLPDQTTWFGKCLYWLNSNGILFIALYITFAVVAVVHRDGLGGYLLPVVGTCCFLLSYTFYAYYNKPEHPLHLVVSAWAFFEDPYGDGSDHNAGLLSFYVCIILGFLFWLLFFGLLVVG